MLGDLLMGAMVTYGRDSNGPKHSPWIFVLLTLVGVIIVLYFQSDRKQIKEQGKMRPLQK
jgi:hypothetical protein